MFCPVLGVTQAVPRAGMPLAGVKYESMGQRRSSGEPLGAYRASALLLLLNPRVS